MTKQKQYIDRTALLRQAETLFDGQREVMGVKAEHIYSAPVADVAEVVRCKDCARRGTEDCAMYYACECGEQHTWESDNDFCSWGVRKEDGGSHDKTE